MTSGARDRSPSAIDTASSIDRISTGTSSTRSCEVSDPGFRGRDNVGAMSADQWAAAAVATMLKRVMQSVRLEYLRRLAQAGEP